MAEKEEDKDVEIIRNVLSVQHVPVVGSLAWDKLQFLLHSFCDRISSQAARLEKAEEQGKSLANFKDELNLLSQNAAAAAKAEKEAEAQKQSKVWEAVETRLTALEELMGPLKGVPNIGAVLAQLGGMPNIGAALAQLGDIPNTGVALAQLNDMPKRVSAVEGQLSSVDNHVKQIDAHVHQIDNDLQALDSGFTNKESKGGGMDNAHLTERIRLLEQDIEEFQELMDRIMKAHTVDLEAIQRVQRTFRADLEAKLLGQANEGGSNNPELAEIQKQLERKADVDVVEQLIRASTNTKDGLEALTRLMEELKKGIRKSSRFSVKINETTTSDSFIPNSRGGDDYESPVKKLEGELATLTNKLSTKADRTTIDEIQFKLAIGGGGNGGGDDALKDLFAKKVDRDEMLELLKSYEGGSNVKELTEKINTINNSVAALAERSDLAVLLSKRAEQIAHPVAIIHGAGGHTDDEEIQLVVNEHANRIMVYADMLLQMQVVLATKVDNSALSALRDIVEKMQSQGGGASKVALEAQEKDQEQMKLVIKSHEKMLLKLLEDVGIVSKGVLIMSGHDDEFHPDKILPSPTFTTTSQSVIPSVYVTPNLTNRENFGGGGGSNGDEKEISNQTNASTTQVTPSSTHASSTQVMPSSTPASPPSSLNVEATSPFRKTSDNFASTLVPNSPIPSTSIASKVNVSEPRPLINPPLESLETTLISPPISTNKKRSLTPSRKSSRFGSPSSTARQASILHVTNVQEASQVVAESKYHETLVLLEDAINAKKLEPKENVAVLKGLLIEVEKMSVELENNLILIDNLEQNKVDKIDFQALAKIVKELKAMETAMLSGKPILGFKCMSCNHDLEKLNPTRGPTIPTGQMPPSFFSMLSAERIFSMNKRDISPIHSPPSTPKANTRSNMSIKTIKRKSITTQ